MTEKFLSTLLLMFIASCYFIYNARRDTDTEKEFDTDDTRARSSSDIQEERNGQKNNF